MLRQPTASAVGAYVFSADTVVVIALGNSVCCGRLSVAVHRSLKVPEGSCGFGVLYDCTGLAWGSVVRGLGLSRV